MCFGGKGVDFCLLKRSNSTVTRKTLEGSKDRPRAFRFNPQAEHAPQLSTLPELPEQWRPLGAPFENLRERTTRSLGPRRRLPTMALFHRRSVRWGRLSKRSGAARRTLRRAQAACRLERARRANVLDLVSPLMPTLALGAARRVADCVDLDAHWFSGEPGTAVIQISLRGCGGHHRATNGLVSPPSSALTVACYSRSARRYSLMSVVSPGSTTRGEPSRLRTGTASRTLDTSHAASADFSSSGRASRKPVSKPMDST